MFIVVVSVFGGIVTKVDGCVGVEGKGLLKCVNLKPG
jgi:hypothetical protein